jgi:hypothetical protein
MQLIDQHISDENWHILMHWARQAAERGEKEFMLLRFPSQLCDDAGRRSMRAYPIGRQHCVVKHPTCISGGNGICGRMVSGWVPASSNFRTECQGTSDFS